MVVIPWEETENEIMHRLSEPKSYIILRTNDFMGTKAGATALRQSIDATMKHVSLKDYAKNHLELKLALERWR